VRGARCAVKSWPGCPSSLSPRTADRA
jgi:hypothetical protein